MTRKDPVLTFRTALPFWASLLMVPLAILAALQGGVWVLILPVYGWLGFSLLDAITGLNTDNIDPETPDDQLHWYRLITLIWFPIQFLTIFGMIWWVTHSDHQSVAESILLFFGVGVISGTIGINYSHELMHQKPKSERWLADLLLATVMYSHFRSEHLLVHHRYVATPRDPVTARYNEGFHRFFPRVLHQCYASAWDAEKSMLARRNQPVLHPSNPFLRYWILQAVFVGLAFVIGGWFGILLFLYQAFVAIWQLELVNYIEHYGLTRKHLGDGKYEHVLPRHSWNAAHRASNWLLINLQRHSDHHYKPNRRFPLLQTYSEDDAPQLPYGYPIMTVLAMVPPAWRRYMNPKVREWRKTNYPEITDWSAYKSASNPMPK
ncbi:MAG: alkane 1-monooxygenase [Pseudoruegeria sp.]